MAAFAAGLLSACTPPKYAHYRSVKGDWTADVPWGWNVIAENESSSYGNTALIGGFEPDFYLGVPSLQVRWFAYGYPHKLRDGELEFYPSVDDYVRQTLELTYGKEREMKVPVQDLPVAGRTAKYFVVLSPREAPRWATWGTSISKEDGKVGILRQHAYVVLPLSRGFYVLIYPATAAGFKLYEKHFNELVHTFKPLAEGPGGPPVGAAAAAPAAPAPAVAKKRK